MTLNFILFCNMTLSHLCVGYATFRGSHVVLQRQESNTQQSSVMYHNKGYLIHSTANGESLRRHIHSPFYTIKYEIIHYACVLKKGRYSGKTDPF